MRAVTSVAFAAVCCACAPAAPPPTPVHTPVTYQIPQITAADPTKESQVKDGITIIAAPVPFQAVERVQRVYKPVLLLGGMINPSSGDQSTDMRETFSLAVDKGAVKFKIRVKNGLPRVLRLSGSVVNTQVKGRSVSIPPDRYAEWLNSVILPQQEAELEITGPDVSAIAGTGSQLSAGDSVMVALFLFDIVTATDAAGNATKRSNFEFNYVFKVRSQTLSKPPVVSRHAVTYGTWVQLRQAQGIDSKAWVDDPRGALNCLPACKP